MMVLGRQQVSHRRGRGGRQEHVSIAQLLEPAKVSHYVIISIKGVHTVNGRTLMATLMEEAPSDAAIVDINTHSLAWS